MDSVEEVIKKNKFKHEFLHFLITISALGLGAYLVSRCNNNWNLVWKSKDTFLVVLFIQESLKATLVQIFGDYKDKEHVNIMKAMRDASEMSKYWGLITCNLIGIFVYICFYSALGAPLEKLSETLVVSCLLTFLTVTPVAIVIGLDGILELVFHERFKPDQTPAAKAAVNLVKYNIVGALFGSVVGSLLIFAYGWMKNFFVYPIPNWSITIVACLLCNCYGCLHLLYDKGIELWQKRLQV